MTKRTKQAVNPKTPATPGLDPEQSAIFKLLETTSDNYFITGKAGTGKSFLLRHFVSNTKKNLAVIAPTGIAAINVEGETIHRFFGLDIAVQMPEDRDAVSKNMSQERLRILRSLDCLIIDEISMVRVDVMCMIDAKLRYARKQPKLPFGGCQIVVFGDLYQLPPVTDRNNPNVLEYLMATYHTIFFFGAPAVTQKPFVVKELSTIHRQTDRMFIDILNQIRVGKDYEHCLSDLNAAVGRKVDDERCLSLVPTNKAAAKINAARLEAIPCEETLYEGDIYGDFSKEDMPTEYYLRLKPGAKVMMLRNDQEKRWVNGTIAIIDHLTNDQIFVRINGIVYSVDRAVWDKHKYVWDKDKHRLTKQKVGYFQQFPVKLAYAITIHKSQGQTYDTAIVDYSEGGAFAAGQTYVALSRCKSFDKLSLTIPLTPEDIHVSQEVIAFMNGSYVPQPITHVPYIETTEKDDNVTVEWLPDRTIRFDTKAQPKKITGTRFSQVLGQSSFVSPFASWCDITKLYSAPFEETKYTIAGKVIEPKQFEFARAKYEKEGMRFVRPADKFGDDPMQTTHGDFFSYKDVFGGMWDYICEKDGKPYVVFEMKTTSVRYEARWRQQIPEDKLMQAALYAYLLRVDYFYIVASFLQPEDYDHPEGYVCTDANTIIRGIKTSTFFSGERVGYITHALQWWDRYVTRLTSPQYDPLGDVNTINAILERYGSRNVGAVPRAIKCPSCGSNQFKQTRPFLTCEHCGQKFIP